MNRRLIISKLHQLTGGIHPAPSSTAAELISLRRSLSVELVKNPELTVEGNRVHHETRQVEFPSEFGKKLEQLLDTVDPSKEDTAAPLVFRREAAFQNDFLGTAAPSWGAGMAPSKTFGPFLTEHGIHVWFDFFTPITKVEVYLNGETTPALMFSTRGILLPKKSYKIEAGSVWIASHLIANDSSLNGAYTGLKISGGTLDLSVPAQIISERISIPGAATAQLRLELDQKKRPAPSIDAGLDADDAVVMLPNIFGLTFSATASSVQAAEASCTVFGCNVRFTSKNAAPIALSQFGQILIPYLLHSDAVSTDIFEVNQTKSNLCRLKGKAKITLGSGWLLPIVRLQPAQLGAAAGTGALCIGLSNGIDTKWKGLEGGSTRLLLPAIVIEPGMVTVIDFFAANRMGKQKWTLWRNAPGLHHSEVEGKSNSSDLMQRLHKLLNKAPIHI